MNAAPAKNGNGWATKLLMGIYGVALALAITLNGLVLSGQQEIGEQGRKNATAIEGINATLSARAAEERASFLRQIAELQAQQRQERETQEPAGRPAPSGE